MSYVVFENNGVIDERSIKTFGISVKETENPIGYFGTGLKYAIAILMRHKQEFLIMSGGHVYEFKPKMITVRGKEFEIITMNGEELPFTTELGKNWEMWQAFREIYCNALDEKGSCETYTDIPTPDPAKTYFIVNGKEFLTCYFRKNEIVLNMPTHLMVGSGEVEVYKKPNEFLYYRGIRVMQMPKVSKLTYNIINELELTEDRTIKYPSYGLDRIPRAISRLTNKNVIRDILTCDQGYFENEMNYSTLEYWEKEVTPEFDEILSEQYHLNDDRLNASAKGYFVKKKNKNATKNYEKTELTEVESKQLERCRKICRDLYDDFDQYKIIIVKTLGQTTKGLADMDQKMIVISRDSFLLGTKFVLSTMIEEYTHLKTGYRDHTRELQTYLFDTICSMIENHVLREPI